MLIACLVFSYGYLGAWDFGIKRVPIPDSDDIDVSGSTQTKAGGLILGGSLQVGSSITIVGGGSYLDTTGSTQTKSGSLAVTSITVAGFDALTVDRSTPIKLGGLNLTGDIQTRGSGNVVVDQDGLNSGLSINGLLRLGGTGSQEGWGSKRTAGDGQYGVQAYTFSQIRMHIDNNGNIGVNTLTPGAAVHISSAAGYSGLLLQISTGASEIMGVTGSSITFNVPIYGDGANLTGISAGGASPSSFTLIMGGAGDIYLATAASTSPDSFTTVLDSFTITSAKAFVTLTSTVSSCVFSILKTTEIGGTNVAYQAIYSSSFTIPINQKFSIIASTFSLMPVLPNETLSFYCTALSTNNAAGTSGNFAGGRYGVILEGFKHPR